MTFEEQISELKAQVRDLEIKLLKEQLKFLEFKIEQNHKETEQYFETKNTKPCQSKLTN